MRTADLTDKRTLSAAANIRQATTTDDIARARALFVEYAQWLKVDLCFQGFAEELKALPAAYAPPRGRLLLAGTTGDAFACIALRPLDSAGLAEVKRLYVQPARRGERWGYRLAENLIAEARAIGYRELKLDTLEWMTPARALYASLGFRECAGYYDNPLAGVVYMRLELS
ncbi:MAG TPA: GNAT family N-acetyltransferase [Casimicrobiaceae bacterium]|nr:GNAT family N-acetyltransferase [Casimicrobiaceae bacterium]